MLSFRKFVQHIADHGGHSRGKVRGVLSDMCACLVEMLLEGKKVQLDELGDFWISLSSDGAESLKTFTSENIKAVNIVFTLPSTLLLGGRLRRMVTPSKLVTTYS